MNKPGTLKKLNSVLEIMKIEIESRNKFFENKSIHWQESKKGQSHEIRTQELIWSLDNLLESIISFKQYIIDKPRGGF